MRAQLALAELHLGIEVDRRQLLRPVAVLNISVERRCAERIGVRHALDRRLLANDDRVVDELDERRDELLIGIGEAARRVCVGLEAVRRGTLLDRHQPAADAGREEVAEGGPVFLGRVELGPTARRVLGLHRFGLGRRHEWLRCGALVVGELLLALDGHAQLLAALVVRVELCLVLGREGRFH